jgi:cell division protein FtsN
MVSPTGPYERLLPSRLGLSAYTIQVGSFGNEGLAAAEAAKLNASTRSVSGPRPLYLVLVGSFSKYEEAQKELARLARQGYTDAFILP